jgi:hypothetical protein
MVASGLMHGLGSRGCPHAAGGGAEPLYERRMLEIGVNVK